VKRYGVRLLVRAGHGNVLRDGDTHKVDHEQEPVDDAEELEGDAIKIHQEDGKAEGKKQTCD